MVRTTSNIKRCCQFFIAIVVATVVLSMNAKAATTPAAVPPDRLQTLIRETVAQFQIAYRLHPEEGGLRQQQLNAVVDAWRSAPRNDANNERLASWLRAAIRASMPGSREALPASPAFAGAPTKAVVKTQSVEKPRTPEPTLAVPAVARVAPTTATPASAPTANHLETDPFRDDPEDE
jgi:hypothetical protein